MEEHDEEALKARFEPVLRSELASLAEASGATTDDRKPVELDQQSVGRLSRMDAMQGQAMAAAIEARRAGRSRAIAAALSRMEDGEFGYCEDCGEPIALKRLDLDPTVTRCISCAS
jgi:DnaK suppressor protein